MKPLISSTRPAAPLPDELSVEEEAPTWQQEHLCNEEAPRSQKEARVSFLWTTVIVYHSYCKVEFKSTLTATMKATWMYKPFNPRNHNLILHTTTFVLAEQTHTCLGTHHMVHFQHTNTVNIYIEPKHSSKLLFLI